MRIMHIASFQGNIGDIQNHRYFYDSLRKNSCCNLEVIKIEIREFYFSIGLRKFDMSFVDEINKCDLLIIGGGSFFDVRWEQSATATSLDISPEFIDNVRIPVLINAMGYNEYTESDELFARFERFINHALKKQWYISLRNDGSYARMKNRFPRLNMNQLHVVPDNALAAPCGIGKMSHSRITLGFCISVDLFCSKYNKNITSQHFVELITNIINELLQEGKDIIFFTHTPQDVKLVAEIMEQIPAIYKRLQVSVSVYDVSTEECVEQYLRYYRSCDVVVAMRFHANIFALTQRIPCIALSGHGQISGLFHELGLDEQCIIVNREDFGNDLFQLINDAIDNPHAYIKKEDVMLEKVNKEHYRYITEVTEIVKMAMQ